MGHNKANWFLRKKKKYILLYYFVICTVYYIMCRNRKEVQHERRPIIINEFEDILGVGSHTIPLALLKYDNAKQNRTKSNVFLV